jgi:hypothetical protein
MTIMKSLHQILLAALTIVLCARLAPAGEVYAPSMLYDTVTLAPWAPTARVSSVTVTNGGAFGSTGVVYYALQPQNRLGLAPLGPVTSATVTATGQLVRIRWAVPAGATNVLVWRGPTTNLGSYVAAARSTNLTDYGTNAWSTGTVAVTATSVVELILIGDSTSPNAAISRAQAEAIIGLTNALTEDDVFGGDVVGPYTNLQLGAGAVGEAALDSNVMNRMAGGYSPGVTNVGPQYYRSPLWLSGLHGGGMTNGLHHNIPAYTNGGLIYLWSVDPAEWIPLVAYDGALHYMTEGHLRRVLSTWDLTNSVMIDAQQLGGVAGSEYLKRSGFSAYGATTNAGDAYFGSNVWVSGGAGSGMTNGLHHNIPPYPEAGVFWLWSGDPSEWVPVVAYDSGLHFWSEGTHYRVITDQDGGAYFLSPSAAATTYLRNTTAQPTNFSYSGSKWQTGWQNIAGVTTQRLFVMHDGTGWYYQVWNRMPTP